MQVQLIESPFAFHELFFSKTDSKGIIKSANSVFQRVSEYPWEEVLNRPHNLIRHPDMPRAVFYLLWKFLKAGQPIGAFVKNRSKTGRYYWVFALAFPIEAGFLSVRIKPGGPLLKIIEKEYAQLRALENSKNLKPEQSAELLLERLKELGYKDYESFMTEALVDQLENRSTQLSKKVSGKLIEMKEMIEAGQKTKKTAQEILQAFKKSKFVPLNLEIHSSKHGDKGKQMSVVASQYQKMVLEINQEIERFEKMSTEVLDQVNKGRFLIGSSELLNEINRFLSTENNGDDTEGQKEIATLVESYLADSKKGVGQIIDIIRSFESVCESLRALGAGLELVRITGKIETSALNQATDIHEMLNSLRVFQTSLNDGLRGILTENAHMKDLSSNLLYTLQRSL